MKLFCMLKSNKGMTLALFAGLVAVSALVAPDAMAGTTGTEFQSIYTTITGWMSGYLGRLIAATFVIVGIVSGIARGSIFGFVLGVAAGLGLFAAPTIIDGVVTATLPVIGG